MRFTFELFNHNAGIVNRMGENSMITLNRRRVLATMAVVPALLLGAPAFAQGGDVTLTHYFTGEFGLKIFNEQVAKFEAATDYTIKNSPIGHEDFKTDILVRAAGDSLPDVFSYWAGARTQFVVDSGSLHTIDEMWARDGLDNVSLRSPWPTVPPCTTARAIWCRSITTTRACSITPRCSRTQASPKCRRTWDGFLALCETLKGKGVTPIALGSKNRWPAQFWFDYLLLGTAGPDYRAGLMNGSAALMTTPRSRPPWRCGRTWRTRATSRPNANADSWTDASDKVARGDAAMTLMGTWITGYWNGLGLEPGKDYDFFPFPSIADGVPCVGGRPS